MELVIERRGLKPVIHPDLMAANNTGHRKVGTPAIRASQCLKTVMTRGEVPVREYPNSVATVDNAPVVW